MRRRQLVVAVMAILLGSGLAISAAPTAQAETGLTSGEISALDIDPATVLSGNLNGDPTAAAALTNPIGGFPTHGSNYLALSTGQAADIVGTPSSFASTDLANAAVGADGHDLTRAHLHLRPPSNATCLEFDFAFLSEEYPEYVGSEFNDIFTAELAQSQFSMNGNQVVAPNNFAYDSEGHPVSVNTVFGLYSVAGTTMNAGTPVLSAATPIKRNVDGTLDVFLSVQDLGDPIYDSAVLIDNMRFSSNPECKPGATALEDSDGDGLPNVWETNGIDNNNDGKIDLDLKAMGADPQHKDIFIETDWMQRPGTCIWIICWGERSFTPQSAALGDVRAAFAAAPVTNPDGTTGIRVHIDAGSKTVMNPVTGATWGSRSQANEVPHDAVLGTNDAGQYNWTEFDGLKRVNFAVNRRDAFHYMLFGDTYSGTPTTKCSSGLCSSGISRAIPASDTIITDGHSSWNDGFTRIQERGTVMHELGHNLGLRHGGGDDTPFKSDYFSIMNYLFQLPGLPPDSRLDYSRGNPFNDWTHLVFDGGSVGAFGDVTLPATSESDELDPQTAKAHGVFATDGDGTVHFVGPTLLLPGTGIQQLAFDVTNVGTTTAIYTVAVDGGSLPLSTSSATISLAGGATGRVNLAIDTSRLPAGTYPFTVKLTSNTAGDELFTGSDTITAPDLSDPAQLQQAREALTKLRALPTDSGLDPAVRDALARALVTALPWKATLAMTGSPTDTLTADYTVHSPTFIPDPTSRQRIKVAAWPGTRPLTLSLTRVQPTSADYKGTLHLQRPDGRVIDATVSLVWTPSTNTFQGNWTAKSGGGMRLTLSAP